MYLDLWIALKNQSHRIHTGSDLRRMMNELEQRAHDQAKFERQPHKALRHLRRINLIGMEEEELEINGSL